MLRRPIIVTALAALISIAAMAVATPAFAKGPLRAQITGPGLARAVVVSGPGEPGQVGLLLTLAEQTSLFTVLFGPGGSLPGPRLLRSEPQATALGPRYAVVYTVPGVPPQGSEQFGRIRQDLYPRAAGGPVIYTPPGQRGFGGRLRVTGWFWGSPRLLHTLTKLGVPTRAGERASQRQTRGPRAGQPAPAHQAGGSVAAWLIASVTAVAAVALLVTAFWPRRRKPAAV
jgi:hypothetical protein